MKKLKIPSSDSIRALAAFWDRHDLTDFEDQLEQVTDPVFERTGAIRIHLDPCEAQAVKRMARARGISREQLIREWVVKKLPRRQPARRAS